MVLLHLPLEDAPHVLNRVQVWRHTWQLHHLHLQQQGSCHLGGVFGVVMFENSFWREGIIFYFRISQYMLESMFPSMNRSSPVPAVVMKPPCCSVWRMVWELTSWPSNSGTSKAMLAVLMRPFIEASFCTWCTHNIFDRPLRGLFWVKPVLENLRMTLAAVLQLSSRLLPNFLQPRPSLWRATILILKSPEFFAMRCHVDHPVWENCTQRTTF